MIDVKPEQRPTAAQVEVTTTGTEATATAEPRGWPLLGAGTRKPRTLRFWVLLASAAGAAVAVAVVLAVLYGGERHAAVDGDSPGVTATAASAGAGAESESDPVKVGTVLSLTGPQHSSGEAIHQSYARLVEDAQGAGGILLPDSGERLPIELVVWDDGSDAAQHLAQLERLMDVDRVDLVVLPMPTAPLDDVAALAQTHGYRVMEGASLALGLQTSDVYLLEFLLSMFGNSP